MINNQDKDQQELEAMQLIDQAERLANRGKGEEAIKLYEKAAQIYLDFGSYIELDKLFIRIIEIISQFKNHIQAIYRLKSIIRKTEELELEEISAKLLTELGNISYKMNDWESAGESWEKASDYLYKIDPDEDDHHAALLLLKAGQVYERSPIKKDYGKRLILKAVMRINKFDELYEQEEKRAFLLIKGGEFEAAANKFYDIAEYFRKALDNLGEIFDEQISKETQLNAKARFIHFIAEYQTVTALCLRSSENHAYNEKIKELGYDAIDLFKNSIGLLKEYLFPIKSNFDKEIILRITFDTMLLTIVQEMLGTDGVDTIQFLFKDINTNKNLVKKIKESPYFKITENINKIGIINSLNKLLNIHLGHFEEIKNTLISYFIET
ncbi:MAG: hypothetical protein EU535_01060 [Promethearchaeota archaeon]|nr:MAG: hypothetical protein EU535_01060 [Candidatus Lokiarchaeota archaeon]